MKPPKKNIWTRVEALEARMIPNNDWRQMSMDEYMSVTAEQIRERVFKKLGGEVYDLVCVMSDEELLRSVIELAREFVFGSATSMRA